MTTVRRETDDTGFLLRDSTLRGSLLRHEDRSVYSGVHQFFPTFTSLESVHPSDTFPPEMCVFVHPFILRFRADGRAFPGR
jgi:hypothetical protein